MAAHLRNEEGIGLIELLIAMVVMSIGLFALVAGFSSGVETTRRASKTSTAGTLADIRMEAYRLGTYATISSKDAVDPPVVGPDGRTYYVTSTSAVTCIFGGTPAMDNSLTPPALRCAAVTGPPAYPKTRPVKVVTVTVGDGAKALVTQSSTFEESTGS